MLHVIFQLSTLSQNRSESVGAGSWADNDPADNRGVVSG